MITLRASGVNEFTSVTAPQRTRYAPKSATINVAFSGDWPEDARTAFTYAKGIWETQLTSSVPISVTASWEDLGSPTILGSAGPRLVNFGGSPPSGIQANTWYPVALVNAIRGNDTLPSNPDIIAQFNSTQAAWYFGTDGQTPNNKIDFASVVLHELGHGLGFVGSMQVSGGQGSWGLSGAPVIYDQFALNGQGIRLLTITSPSTDLGIELQGGDLFFDGSNAMAANGGTAPRLYAPNPFEPGSSYAHLDEDTFIAGDTNSLMTPSLGMAEAIHDTGAITRGIFEDIGWTIPGAVPTPTPTHTPTATHTATATRTPTATQSPTNTATTTATATGTLSPTATASTTHTPTRTVTGTQSATVTATATTTATETATHTPTATSQPTQTGTTQRLFLPLAIR
ncbi:MAG: hypothetical protein H0T73_20340 [Ardenticatenales bacterium]|nr:hypothetical protein [Ardenticatenales bacterium]